MTYFSISNRSFLLPFFYCLGSEMNEKTSFTARDTEVLQSSSDPKECLEISHLDHHFTRNIDISSSDECLFQTLASIDVTSEEREFTNKAFDFCLEIPKGALQEGERLTVDLRVALIGPFKFPKGLRPVSPVFSICVRDQKIQFLKPVKVTIPHFLYLENDSDIESLGVIFLKADHNMNSKGLYEFLPTDEVADFKGHKTHGVLKTSHFCSLCIGCKDGPEVLTKTSFCLTSVIPECAISPGRKQSAFFFITSSNFSTCFSKVDELIEKKGLQNHKKKHIRFNFKTETNKPALEMIINNPKHGFIGCVGIKKVGTRL